MKTIYLKKQLRNNSGDTLIELLLYITLLSILLLVVTIILFNLSIFQNTITTTANTNDTVRIAMKEMTQNIEYGYQVMLPNSGTITSSELTIQTDSTGDTISFYSQNGVIYSQINDQQALPLSSSNIYTFNLQFTEEANTGISPTVFITLTETNVGNTGIQTSKTYETASTQRR